MKKYLETTSLLDYKHPKIQKLVNEREWKQLEEKEKIKQVYNFVRDEILFGYNIQDNISASQILEDNLGQCNTKAVLLMALMRAVGIPNRIHGFTINKALQRGAITGIWYLTAPKNILHSWVEILVGDNWYYLEGVILDKGYLSALQKKFADRQTNLCGYGAYTEDFKKPVVDWNYNHTFIQEKGINQDFGLFDNPDDFFSKYQQDLSPLKNWVYRNYMRHTMNKNVSRIRNGS